MRQASTSLRKQDDRQNILFQPRSVCLYQPSFQESPTTMGAQFLVLLAKSRLSFQTLSRSTFQWVQSKKYRQAASLAAGKKSWKIFGTTICIARRQVDQYLYISYTCIQHLSNVSTHFPIKGVVLASPFSPVPRDAISYSKLLLLDPGSCHRRRPNPISRQTLVGIKSLHRPHPLSHYMEYYLELSRHDFLMYLGCSASQHPMSQEESGEQLY